MKNNLHIKYDYKNYFKDYTTQSVKPNLTKSVLKNEKLSYYKNSFLFNTNKSLNYISLKKNQYNFRNTQKTLALNFKRQRFFPTIRTLKGESYSFLSLGMLSKFFQKNKSFLKTKTMYLLLMSFFRKILLFSSLKYLILTISKTPLYLKEILNTLNNPVTKFYKNPFDEKEVNEKVMLNPFKFSFIIFINNKPFIPLKLKKKGRLKRKISKRITLLNRIID